MLTLLPCLAFAGEVSVMTQLTQSKLRLTRMIVDGIEVPLDLKRPVTMLFREEGKVSGFGGVNRYNATAEIQGTRAAFGAAASTRMAGSPELMVIESKFFRALPQVTHFGKNGNTVVFSDLGRTVLLELVVE